MLVVQEIFGVNEYIVKANPGGLPPSRKLRRHNLRRSRPPPTSADFGGPGSRAYLEATPTGHAAREMRALVSGISGTE